MNSLLTNFVKLCVCVGMGFFWRVSLAEMSIKKEVIPSNALIRQEKMILKDIAFDAILDVPEYYNGYFYDDYYKKFLENQGWVACLSKLGQWSAVAELGSFKSNGRRMRTIYFLKNTGLLSSTFVKDKRDKTGSLMQISIIFVDFMDHGILDEKIKEYELKCP